MSNQELERWLGSVLWHFESGGALYGEMSRAIINAIDKYHKGEPLPEPQKLLADLIE